LFVATTRVPPFVHARSGMPVDIVLAGPGLEELFFKRRRRLTVEGVRVPVASPEDVAVMKVLAGRGPAVRRAAPPRPPAFIRSNTEPVPVAVPSIRYAARGGADTSEWD